MSIIHMDTDVVYAQGRQMIDTASTMMRAVERLQWQVNRLRGSWTSPQADYFFRSWDELHWRLSTLAEELDHLANRMMREADEWISVDQAHSVYLQEVRHGLLSRFSEFRKGIDALIHIFTVTGTYLGFSLRGSFIAGPNWLRNFLDINWQTSRAHSQTQALEAKAEESAHYLLEGLLPFFFWGLPVRPLVDIGLSLLHGVEGHSGTAPWKPFQEGETELPWGKHEAKREPQAPEKPLQKPPTEVTERSGEKPSKKHEARRGQQEPKERRLSLTKGEVEDLVRKSQGRLPYEKGEQCVAWARKRRRTLGGTSLPPISKYSPNDWGADHFIQIFKGSVVHITKENVAKSGLQIPGLEPGAALVWPRGHSMLKGSAGYRYGHVAIVEAVEKDRVWVSQANWPGKQVMAIPKEKLVGLYVVPPDAHPSPR